MAERIVRRAELLESKHCRIIGVKALSWWRCEIVARPAPFMSESGVVDALRRLAERWPELADADVALHCP